MSKTNKIVILVAVILIVVLGIFVINKNIGKENSNAVESKTTNEVATKKTNGIYEIYNADIKTNTGATIFIATIKNISEKATEKQMIEISLLDKNGSEIGIIKVTVPGLEQGKSTEIHAEDLKVYENITDFKIK